jgi:hypothetical protein
MNKPFITYPSLVENKEPCTGLWFGEHQTKVLQSQATTDTPEAL